MAKRRSSSRGSSGRTAAPKPAPRRAKPAPSADVEVVEEAPGEGIDTGIAVITTVVLVAAILFVDALLGHFGAGMFF